METLLKLIAGPPLDRGVSLLCLSQDGRPRREFRPGRKGRHVVVTSCHAWSWPDQVVLLNPERKVVREYWHSGHLLALALADADGDGVAEIEQSNKIEVIRR